MLRHAFITLICWMKENKMVSYKAILIVNIDNSTNIKDQLMLSIGSITWLRAKKLYDILNEFFQYIWANTHFKEATKPMR